jgi:hypothetical protein
VGHRTVNGFELNPTVSNTIQTRSNLILSEQGLPILQKFEIKYGFEGFDERNNFSYKNFYLLEMEFEIKFRETFVS